MAIAAYLCLSYSLANLDCRCFSVSNISVSSRSVLFPLPSESFLSFPHSFHFHVAMQRVIYLEFSILCCKSSVVDLTNHIWRISNLHCKSSVAWLTVQTLFGEPIISDVRYQIFYILPIMIIAYLFYHDTIIITIYVPPLAYNVSDISHVL